MDESSNLQSAYMEAYLLACGQLLKREPAEVCMNTKAVFNEETGVYSVRYFGLERRVRRDGGEIAFEDGEAPLKTTEKVLVLHYLVNSRPAPLSGRLISFKEIQNGGAMYYPTFKKRAIDPLAEAFSGDPEGLYEAARAIGGSREALGDAGVAVNIFPLVPVTYVIWKGDDEIAPSGNVLFDSSVSSFLPVEDIVVAASAGTYRLISERHRKSGCCCEDSCIR